MWRFKIQQNTIYDSESDSNIIIHSEEEFSAMRKAGVLAASVLDYITDYVKEDVTTEYINKISHEYILKNNAIPAPLNYRGFPKSICTSVNHVVCHGIPGSKKLVAGDIVNIDVTVILDGWHGDTSRMFFIGEPKIKCQKHVNTTFESMWEGIKIVAPDTTLGDIGEAIQSYAELRGYSIVRDYCGHGIGKVFHDAPSVLHYGTSGLGLKLKKGMFFTIEPMLNIGRPEVKLLADDWTVVTRDHTLSAQFEHTIGVTDTGYEVFTKSPKNFSKPPFIKINT